MERFVVGSVVVSPFPFSDLKTKKYRPSVVLAVGDFGDLILCQITSFKDDSLHTVTLDKKSFSEGGLPRISYARPDKLFTTDSSIIAKKVGSLSPAALKSIRIVLKELFQI